MFEVLRSEAEKHSLNGRALIDEWYKLDTNAVPNMYILQVIQKIIIFYLILTKKLTFFSTQNDLFVHFSATSSFLFSLMTVHVVSCAEVFLLSYV